MYVCMHVYMYTYIYIYAVRVSLYFLGLVFILLALKLQRKSDLRSNMQLEDSGSAPLEGLHTFRYGSLFPEES